MPYTLAHPAAILPLRYVAGGRLRLAALVIGALTPDFEYFLRLNAAGSFSHSLAGLFVVCLPMGWLSVVLFDRLGRDGVQALLPAAWRLPAAPRGHGPLWISISTLLGASTHIGWDGFTHANGWALRWLPVLSEPVSLLPVAVPWFKVLQHGSTILGLGLLTLVAIRWCRQQPRVSLKVLARPAASILVVLGTAGVLNGLRFASEGLRPFVVAAGVAVTFTASLGLLAVGAWTRIRARRQPT